MMRKGCLVAMAAMLLTGCGNQPAGAGDTPDATFTQFDEAMRAKQFDQAAALIDYGTLAMRENPDWESFPTGQQHQIIEKMRADAAVRLGGMGYPSAGMTATGMVSKGDAATIKASGEGQSLTLGMVQTEAGWLIVSGLPTMTTD